MGRTVVVAVADADDVGGDARAGERGEAVWTQRLQTFHIIIRSVCSISFGLIFSRIGFQDTLISLDVDYWVVSLSEKSVELENVIISDEREKKTGTQRAKQMRKNKQDHGETVTLK